MRKGKKNTLILDWYMKWKPSLIKINKRITQFSYLNFLELGSNSPHYILVKIITKSKWKMNYAFSFFSGQKHSQFHPLSCLRNLALLAWNIASNPLSAFLYDNNSLPWWTQRNVSHLDTLNFIGAILEPYQIEVWLNHPTMKTNHSIFLISW